MSGLKFGKRRNSLSKQRRSGIDPPKNTYRFLVEIPEAARENGLKTYGAYYVPAVEEIHLTSLPVWGGGFN